MKYPKWFPYPSAWLKAISLLIYLGFCIRITLFWGVMGSGFSLSIIPAALGLVCPFLLIAVAHHILLGKEIAPHWLPRWASWKTALNAFIVSLISVGVAVAIVLPLALTEPAYFSIQTQTHWYTVISITVAAYLYHYDAWVRQRRLRRKLGV
ncbi:hypothetical protein [Egbenema bharatensis]|uniref:hypothetical protein n=1 Tax=Egbenema bharatensis TaxID=3463334 RepID=UPI003A8547BF